MGVFVSLSTSVNKPNPMCCLTITAIRKKLRLQDVKSKPLVDIPEDTK